MFDIFKFFQRNNTGNSKDIAKDRLKLVLVHDRANVSPVFLETVKTEIVAVLKKYMDINDDDFDIQLTETKDENGRRIVPALIANIPIKNMKDDKKTT